MPSPLPEPHDPDNCPYPDLINPLVDVDDQGRSRGDGLTSRERAFCEAALDLMQKGEHAWKRAAAKAAGYSDSWAASAAWQLMRREPVQRYIGEALAGAAAKVKVDRSFVLHKAMIGAEIAEAKGDLRALNRFLDIIARHVDVDAFRPDPVAASSPGGSVNLPIDLNALTTDEKRTMLALLSKSGAATAGQPDGHPTGVDQG
jgi:hypothetical protein